MNRYTFASKEFYIPDDNKYDYVPIPIIDIPKSENDIYVEVKKSEQFAPDLIAYNYYGNERYYWVILMANNIFDPFTELYAGRVIRVPDLTFIRLVEFTINRN